MKRGTSPRAVTLSRTDNEVHQGHGFQARVSCRPSHALGVNRSGSLAVLRRKEQERSAYASCVPMTLLGKLSRSYLALHQASRPRDHHHATDPRTSPGPVRLAKQAGRVVPWHNPAGRNKQHLTPTYMPTYTYLMPKMLTVRVDDDLAKQIEDLAKRLNLTQSEVMRNALEAGVAEGKLYAGLLTNPLVKALIRALLRSDAKPEQLALFERAIQDGTVSSLLDRQ